jgi:hypothetical protein
MAVNYQPVNYLKDIDDVVVGAAATETAVVAKIALSDSDSKNIRIRLDCSAAQEVTGISWKLQHSWDNGTSWEDVSPGGSVATVSVYGFSVADSDVTTATEKITETSHSLQTGDAVYYVSSAGSVITGLADDTIYYAIDSGTNDFQVATTYANAIAGTAIDLTQPAGGDTHYFTKTSSELVLNIENSTDEAVLPLYPICRIVASTGASDIFTVSDCWHSRRV